MSNRRYENDPTMNKAAAMNMAHKVQDYWHKKGCPQVSVWVDTVPVYASTTGEKILTRYEINSNIVQDASNITRTIR